MTRLETAVWALRNALNATPRANTAATAFMPSELDAIASTILAAIDALPPTEAEVKAANEVLYGHPLTASKSATIRKALTAARAVRKGEKL